ncbi:MAG TPA: nitroreductase family protein [Bryobacteraceae bacterium]|nr:nitroreductase family protein [Bryobacteraceae bacterium]
MEFFDVLASRNSIRAFAPTPLEHEKLQAILNAANRAPSAGNLQSYEIYMAQRPAQTRAVAGATFNQRFVGQAPVLLVFCSHPARALEEYGERGAQLYSVQDATIACAFAMLAATAQGLATVWIGAFDPDAVRKVIGAPVGITPVAILPIGYPAERPQLTTRRRLDDLVHEMGQRTG